MSAVILRLPVKPAGVSTGWWWDRIAGRKVYAAWYEADENDPETMPCGFGDTERAAVAKLLKKSPRREE